MKLKELLEFVDIYQDMQLINAMTGEVFTPVTYLEGGHPDSLDCIESHKEDIVHGVSAGIANDGEPYLKVTIDCARGRDR